MFEKVIVPVILFNLLTPGVLLYVTKDTRLACDAASTVNCDAPLGQHAAQVFAKACEAGWADLDDAALLQFLRQTN